MLEQAKAGVYPKSSLEAVPARMRERFFEAPRRRRPAAFALLRKLKRL